MQKVVFNAHYLAYCDETSAAWLGEEFGWDGSDDGFDWMLVRAEVDWSGSATYGDVITMTAGVEHWGTTSFRVRFTGGVGERPVFQALITYVSRPARHHHQDAGPRGGQGPPGLRRRLRLRLVLWPVLSAPIAP